MSQNIPVIPIKDMVIFPGIVAPMFIGRSQSLKALENAALNDKKVLVLTQKTDKADQTQANEEPKPSMLYGFGSLCNILQIVRLPDGTTKTLLEGVSRAIAEDVEDILGYFTADATEVSFAGKYSHAAAPLRKAVESEFERYAAMHPKIPAEIAASIASVEDMGVFSDLLCSQLFIKVSERQTLLETINPEERLGLLLKYLTRENELMSAQQAIHEKVRMALEKNHKDYYLREQLKVIHDELGTGEAREIEEFTKRFNKAKMPKEVRKKADKELDRFSKMHPMTPEATVSRTYLDWLADMPWEKSSKDSLSIERAKKILEEDHYGLEEAKERILEFLAVLSMTKAKNATPRAQVLCFVGPPGVGKTSLAKSIARALDRNFVQLSLGGIKDEAEIRGHRRTYIGALPGRIIQKIRTAGTKNPVLLMDEIDKVGNDYRGDPSAALLEVLDPEQNHSFADHFLEVPFDLSKVFFVTTANITHTIPPALLDRMEIITIPGYVEEEKISIAARYLWPRISKETGIEGAKISEAAIKRVISEYTGEAGVRQMDKNLSKIARKLAKKIVISQESGGEPPSLSISAQQVKGLLGAPKVHDTQIPKEDLIGAAVGLAWTQSGGQVLLMQAVHMKGKGEVVFTGNLGDIMQESAQTALGYLRSHDKKLGIKGVEWDKINLHVHVPQGATPKDGPSAGITLALTMLSCLTGRKIRHDVAMTGEITLLGEVLPVGGIREKMLAAKRHGIKEIFLPAFNRPDIEEMPSWVTKGLKFNFVSDVEEVFAAALQKHPRQ